MSALAMVDDRRAWLEWRRLGIGGSDAAAIVGEDPFKTALEVFYDKRGFLPLESSDGNSEPAYWGQRLEPLVIQRFTEESDLYVVERQSRIADHERPWMRATLDGLVTDTPHVVPVDVFKGWTPLGIFEGKTASRRASDWGDEPSLRAQIQVQHNLAVSGLDHAWLAVLLTAPVIRFVLYEIERDQAAIDTLIAIEEKFWQRVLNDDPPPATAADVDVLKNAYADVNTSDQSVALPAQSLELVEGLREGRAAVKTAEEKVAWHEAQLMQLMGDRQVGLIEGAVALTWKQHQKQYVDLEAMRAAHPDLVKQFTSTRTYRQMRLAKKEGEKA